jgi:Cytochrome P460
MPHLNFRQWIIGSTLLILFVAALWASTRSVSKSEATLSASSRTADDPAVTEHTILKAADFAKDYKNLRLMTKDPVSVDPTLSSLCRGVMPDEIKDAKKRSGPHALSFINIYMNDIAADAFHRSRTPYPVGSVIVKEKCLSRDPIGLGGMIKRPPGYDPENGDWEYFYSEEPSTFEGGKIASCVQCHRGASSRDYVFADWAGQIPPATRPSEPR